jgi:RNA polymerase sigma-70 factor (ECF subfamily)
MTERNEAQLIRDSLQGDEAAFETIVRLYQNKVFSLIARMLRDREMALDLTQEVFIKVFKKLADLKDTNRLSSWIMQVAHNTTLDWIKKRRVESVSTDFDDQATQHRLSKYIETPRSLSPEQVVERMTPSQMEELVAELDVKYRTILALRFVDGYQFNEIADIVGLPLSTVKFRKHYAIKLLGQRWIEKYGPPSTSSSES